MTWLRNTLAFMLVLILLVMVFVLVTAATGDAAQIANAIAGVVILLSPLALKYVRLDGATMVAVSYLLALLIAAAALLLSGQAQPDFSSAASVLAFATALFGLQQIVYQAFKDHPATAPLLK